MKCKSKTNILGSTYTIKCVLRKKNKTLMTNSWAGYCEPELRNIVIDNFDDEIYEDWDEKAKLIAFNKIIRHEIIHAFFAESGLQANTLKHDSWADNEEMVDWIAIQFPKLMAVFKELGCEW